jgi:hypothetical protein
MDHTYRGHHIRATALWLSDSKRWTSSIVIATSDGTKEAFGHPVGSFLLTAAEAEWEGVLYAMRWIDRENPK